MDEPHFPVELLEQKRRLWLRLAESLEQSQSALLQGDVAVFEQSTEDQKLCCDQLGKLCQSAWPAVVRGSEAMALLEEIQRIQVRVRHLNRVHAALLRRASRSLRILRNLIAPADVPYAPFPAPPRSYSRLHKG